MKSKDFFNEHSDFNVLEKAILDYEPPILIMQGKDSKGNPILSLSQIPYERAFPSSKAIEINCTNQNNFGYRYDLRLKEEKYKDIFFKVIDDILIYAAKEKDRKKYARCLVDRYKVWCKFWNRENKTLTYEKKQGLFGELFYIREQLKKGKDPEILLRSWKGPEGAPQDFIETSYWAEIKTIKHTSDSVNISSLEQLDNPAGLSEQESLNVTGRLIIIKLNLSPVSSTPLKLINLVTEIRSLLSTDTNARDLFENGLILLGFDMQREKEDDFIAELFDVSIYNANAPDFPKFKVKNVHNAVIGMSYKLSIPALINWKIEDKQENKL